MLMLCPPAQTEAYMQCGPHHGIFHSCGPRSEKVGHRYLRASMWSLNSTGRKALPFYKPNKP